ncbi:MAG TPA: XRE family transcriptional regulator [Actinomycetes bacterium]|jgi:mannose-6-phosphate isomerase-like protein (cupin superfamily)/DNA-binding XRE family transcriptional regulator|nr:XRE family transcriptional regulator [Actinomycetes bacterium]
MAVSQDRQTRRPGRAARSGLPDPALGARLRAERERRDISLSELARRLGVSASLISQIETGKSKPSVVTLYGIASELGLSVDELLFTGNGTQAGQPAPAGVAAAAAGAPASMVPAASEGGDGPVQRAGRRKVIELESGVRWERLTAAHDPDVDFLYCVYDVGGASSSNPALLRHDGKEYGLVISGRLRATVGFESYLLEAGDSVSFPATTPHRYDNAGDEPVRFVTCVVHNA